MSRYHPCNPFRYFDPLTQLIAPGSTEMEGCCHEIAAAALTVSLRGEREANDVAISRNLHLSFAPPIFCNLNHLNTIKKVRQSRTAQLFTIHYSLAVYENGVEYIGMADATMPSLNTLTQTLSGAGIADNVESVIPGHFDAMTLGLSFRTMNEHISMIRIISPR